jgi:hypothetical protein
VSSSLSCSFPAEIIEASKYKAKKKQNKQGGNQAATMVSVDNVAKLTNIGRKPKFPCRTCKGHHLLNHCHGIPKVL